MLLLSHMPTPIQVGKEIKEIDLLELLPPDEGSINQWYGRIGSGKTYCATQEILRNLRKGKIIYANWKMRWEGYDERSSKLKIFFALLGFKKYFFQFPKENFHYMPIDEHFIENFERLTDCIVYLDEGHLAFDSYQMARMSIRDRAAVLHTRHFDRTINIISQRPTAIHVTLRANVNRFFKCEQVLHIWFTNWILFRKTEFQDMIGENQINEEAPIKSWRFWGRRKTFELYESKYMRGDLKTSQPNYARVFEVGWIELFKSIWKI